MKARTKVAIALSTLLVVALGCAGIGYIDSLDLASQPTADPATKPKDVAMLRDRPPTTRGRILAVTTSTAKAGEDIAAGFELTELSRAYYTFLANGYEVEIASPRGGRPPARMDDELIDLDYAFLNDPVAQSLVNNTIRLDSVDPTRYSAVYFVGGKGTMFDFPEDPYIQHIAASIYDAGGVVGAVCHGPAALLNVRLASGEHLLAEKRVTGFTNEEELFIIKDARHVFPFLLEDELGKLTVFERGRMYLDNTIVDGRLVTGQNPWSTWSVAESMVRALGHEPVRRDMTLEEAGVLIVSEYHREGMKAAIALRARLGAADKRLLLQHAVIEAMKGQFRRAYDLHRLAFI